MVEIASQTTPALSELGTLLIDLRAHVSQLGSECVIHAMYSVRVWSTDLLYPLAQTITDSTSPLSGPPAPVL